MREKKWSHAKAGLGGLELLYNSTTFIFLSNLGSNLKNIFLTASEYFQVTSFALKGFMFLFLTIKYALSPNKNIGKLGSWSLALLQATLAGLLAFAAITLGATAVAVISAASVAIDMVINLAKSIYFLIRSEIATDPTEKQFFRGKGKKSALGLVFTGIGVILFILVSMAAPYIGLSAVAAIGLTAGILVAIAGMYAIGAAIYQTFFSPEAKGKAGKDIEMELEDLAELKEDQKLDEALELEENKSFNKKGLTTEKEVELGSVAEWKQRRGPGAEEVVKSSKYWEHEIVKSSSPQEIRDGIQEQIKALEQAIEADSAKSSLFSHLFSEETKRENKIMGLTILEDFVNQIEHRQIHADGGKLKISGVGKLTRGFEIEYNNVEELKTKFNDYIVKNFPGIYQSFYRKTGTTESLFAQAYKLLDNPRYVYSSRVKLQASPLEERGEGKGQKMI